MASCSFLNVYYLVEKFPFVKNLLCLFLCRSDSLSSLTCAGGLQIFSVAYSFLPAHLRGDKVFETYIRVDLKRSYAMVWHTTEWVLAHHMMCLFSDWFVSRIRARDSHHMLIASRPETGCPQSIKWRLVYHRELGMVTLSL